MDPSMHLYRKPRIPAPAADRNRCPFCLAENFKSPGPCSHCGISGYRDGEPPKSRLHPRKSVPLDDGDLPYEIEEMEETLIDDEDEGLPFDL